MTAPIWNGDLSTGDLSQWGAVERKNTGGVWVPVSERISVAKTIDGISSPIADGYLMRVVCKPGDTYFSNTDWRTLLRQYEPIRQKVAGSRSSYTIAILVPSGYPGDGKPFVAPFEMHQSGTVAVANSHLIVRASDVAFDVHGGSAGQAQFAGGFARAADGEWNVYTVETLLDPANGHVELWAGSKGKAMTQLAAKDCATMYSGMTCYPLFGIYRDALGVDDMTVYIAGAREYADLADALAWGNQLCAAPTPPPVDKFAAARVYVEKFRKGSPNIAAAFDETFKALS